MTKISTLSKVLAAGASLTVMSAVAHADELTALKAQLEALQSKVDTMESSASSYNLPEGTSFITGRRGAANYSYAANHHALNNDWAGAENSGYTIAINPTADMPAPVAEITVSGYVRSWVVLGIDGYDGGPAHHTVYGWEDGDDHLKVSSRGSIRTRSRIDTSIGQLRTDIELRADGVATTAMRYAWGEWDMTPNWTLGAGSFFQLDSLIGQPATINSWGAIGNNNVTRRDQVRLTYRDGPLSWAVALEEPSYESETAMPDITTSIQYDLPGGHSLQLVAAVSDWEGVDGEAYEAGALRPGTCNTNGAAPLNPYNTSLAECNAFWGIAQGTAAAGNANYNPGSAAIPSSGDLAWRIGGAGVFNLADIATLGIAASYNEGKTDTNISGNNNAFNLSGDPRKTFGLSGSVGFAVNDVTSFNVFGGYEEDLESVGNRAANDFDNAWTIGANVIWAPVRQFRMSWEVNYGEAERYGNARSSQNAQCSTAATTPPGAIGCEDNVKALQFMWETRFVF